MKYCRICGSSMTPVINFGNMPIANGFLTREQFSKEYMFELRLAFCERCTMVQLVEQPDAPMMFHDQYAFYSSTSNRMKEHFKRFAEHVRRDYLSGMADPLVVEVGCNDGILLEHFVLAGIRHLGIEPSVNVAIEANKKGVKTLCKFFDERLAREIVKEHGQADAFLGANVMCHISNFNSVIAGIGVLLKKAGVVMFEDPYLGDVLEKTSYDQIYDEHVFLFSATSIQYAFQQYGFELIDLEPQGTHGGSMRYVLARKGERKVVKRVHEILAHEKKLGIHLIKTYVRFMKACEQSKHQLRDLLMNIRAEGKRVVGYAATSKSTTVINYCGITPDLVEYISDTTKIKQGKFSPGAHIPIRPYEDFSKDYPEYALLFGWNHFEEIMAKENAFKEMGGKWILYVPTVRVLA